MRAAEPPTAHGVSHGSSRRKVREAVDPNSRRPRSTYGRAPDVATRRTRAIVTPVRLLVVLIKTPIALLLCQAGDVDADPAPMGRGGRDGGVLAPEQSPEAAGEVALE